MLIQNEYIADEPFNKRKVRYQERVTKAVYVKDSNTAVKANLTFIPNMLQIRVYVDTYLIIIKVGLRTKRFT